LAPFPAGAKPALEIERLRRVLSTAEAANGLSGDSGVLLTLGLSEMDGILGGGLSCGALHEIAAARESEIAPASGFALALAARLTRRLRGRERSSVLWIAEDLSFAENGAPYGPGLDAAGILPERLIRVAAVRARDVLWAMEEAMRCRAVGVVIGELRASRIDRVAARRLSLTAAAGNTLGLILRVAPDNAPSPAATRWIIGTAPALASEPASGGAAAPRLLARLVRNRRGRLGAWIVEWNSVEQRFELATDSEPVAGAAFDRADYSTVA
jgi:protein ImuA